MIPLWLLSMPIDVLTKQAKINNLDPNLVIAISKVETNGNTLCSRYEPLFNYILNFRTYADNLGITGDTEQTHQKTSWGPLQIMGAVARELGYQGHLTALCNVELGTKYGCMKLSDLHNKYTAIPDVVAAYNAGSVKKTEGGLYINEKYVDSVMIYYRELTQ